MPYNFFKEIKIRCDECGEVLISKSDTQWITCSCEGVSVLGKSFRKIKGSKYTDLTLLNTENVPEHAGWKDDRNTYYKEN